jgi:hypothetical protein
MQKSQFPNENMSLPSTDLDLTYFAGKNILISAYLASDEIVTGSQGDSPTLESLINSIAKVGKEVSYIPYSDYGITGHMIRFFDGLKRKSISSQISGSQTRWMFTAIFHFCIFLFSNFDLTLKWKARRIRSNGFDSCILFYPYLFSTLYNIFKVKNETNVLLFEVNIEKKFFEFQFSSHGLTNVKNMLVRIINLVEKTAINRSDLILTVAKRDTKTLRSLYPDKSIFSCRLDALHELETVDENGSVKTLPEVLYSNITSRHDVVKITFIGANYSLNVRSVNDIIQIARNLQDCKDKIKFVIIGNVARSFDNFSDLPDNVVFTGFLRDFDDIMKTTDFFMMFDYMGTGVESKCRTYSKYEAMTLTLTKDPEEYRAILKGKLIPFDSRDLIEKFLREFICKKLIEVNSTYPKLAVAKPPTREDAM